MKLFANFQKYSNSSSDDRDNAFEKRFDDGANSVAFSYLNLQSLAQLDDVLVYLVQQLAYVLRLLRVWVYIVFRV